MSDLPPANEDGGKLLYISGDCLRLLEDEYWAELSGEIEMDWKTPEQASSEFLAWRAGYRIIESAILGNIIEG